MEKNIKVHETLSTLVKKTSRTKYLGSSVTCVDADHIRSHKSALLNQFSTNVSSIFIKI